MLKRATEKIVKRDVWLYDALMVLLIFTDTQILGDHEGMTIEKKYFRLAHEISMESL